LQSGARWGRVGGMSTLAGICQTCGNLNVPRPPTPFGWKLAAAFLLVLCGPIGWVIAIALWFNSTRPPKCEACGNRGGLVPLDSPVGRDLVAASAKRTSVAALLLLTCCTLFAVENPGAVAEKVRADQRRELVDAARAWLSKADLDPIPAPKLGEDPRESEKVAAAEIRELNTTLDHWRSMRDGKQDEAALYEWFRGVEARHNDVKRYMKYKGRGK